MNILSLIIGFFIDMAFSTSMDDVHVMRSNIDNSSGLLPPYMWQLNKYMLQYQLCLCYLDLTLIL